VQIIPVDIKTHGKYCAKLVKRLLNELIRSKCDERDERLAKKIRDAQIKKIPYQLVIGDNEIKNKTISFRKYGSEKSEELKLSKFISMLKKEVKIKK
jgi:threonyl-tRNA synthetase